LFWTLSLIAWTRKAPADAKTNQIGDYQSFIKNNISNVRMAKPDDSHKKHMRIVGKLWRDSKGAGASALGFLTRPQSPPMRPGQVASWGAWIAMTAVSIT
jgi:hypothetical protein